MKKWNSTIKQIKDLNYDEKFVIKNLSADKRILEMHRERLSKILKDRKPEEIERQISDMVIRDNAFSMIMESIVKCFEFNMDASEVQKIADSLKTNEFYASYPAETLTKIADHIIKRDLIFSELARLWDIRVSDNEVNESLNGYYKATNESIRSYLNDKEKFENVRNVIIGEIITQEMLRRFKFTLDLKKPEENK